jgi:hypothetical protein
MAVGDRITSARTTSLMRRINALENLLTYGAAASTATSAAHYQGEFTGGPTQHIFYGVVGDGINKNNHALTSEANFISEGTTSGTVDTTGTVIVDYNEDQDVLYSSCNNGVQAWDNGGSQLWIHATGPYFPGLAALDDGNLFALDSGGGTVVYKFTSGGTRSTLLTLPGNSWNIRRWSGTQFSVNTDVAGEGECRIYQGDGTLDATYTNTWGPILGGQADSFEGAHSPVIGELFMGVASGASQGANDLQGPAFYKTDGTWIKAFDISTSAYRNYLLLVDGTVYSSNSATSGKVARYTNTATQTTFKRYPDAGAFTNSVSLGTPDFGATVPAASALLGYRPHYGELRDMRTAIESVATNYYGQVEAGTTDGATTTNKLIQSGQNFDDTVTVGDTVINTTDNTGTTVSAIDSATQLSINADIMATGEDYLIKSNFTVSGSGNSNLFTLAIGTVTDWTTPTVSHDDRIGEDEYSDIESVLTLLEASSLA